jgi:hypothetical protein
MTPTLPPDYQSPEDEVLARAAEVPDPSADDPENWWLDLGCVEFPALPPL